ncbi:prepilin-type N-terminal cleavage/methylation domain-containing protein [Candidatus Nomurabacteria bacterium]|nr:prepilin-type N-terminal cleavage/methylation domain-containing protein [Candidatus Nomurabacteria bacterium]
MVNTKNKQSGITLVELMVVVAIFSVVSSVLLFKYSDFSTNVSLRNLSQDIALSIRKSQTFATSVRNANGPGDSSYPAYGIVFSLESQIDPYLPTPKRFISFADFIPSGQSAPNKIYDSNGTCGSPQEGAECVEAITINSGDSIVEIETDVSGIVSSGSVHITFRRPSPDAIICYIPSGQSSCVGQASYAKIKIRSAKGLTKVISVWNTGQINVE